MDVFQRRRLVLGILAFLVLFVIAVLFAIPKIQDDRATAAENQLRAAGITGVEVTFSGQDGTLTGPAALKDAALAAVKDRDGMRSLTYTTPTPGGSAGGSTTTTAAGGAGATTVPVGGSSVPPSTVQGLGLATTIAGSTITLTGNVPTATDKAALTSEATTAFGVGKVNDQVQVVGGAWDGPGKKAFDAYRTFLATTGARLRSGNLNQTAGTLEASGVGFSKEAAAALNQSLNTIKAAGTAVNGGISDPPPAADGAALQAELTELLGRSGINFTPTSAVIDARSKAVLDTAAQGILAGPAVQIEIGGHTDSTGPAAQNQALSLQRAQAVRTYLIQKGVPAARLTAVGYGATKPIADNATPEGRARNRRIEFTVKQ